MIDKPDRIVVLNDRSFARGGATALALLAAHKLAGRGHAATYFCGDDAGIPALAAAGIETVSLGQQSLADRPAILRGLYNRDAARALRTWIAQNDTPHTVYHLHNWAHILSPSIFGVLRPVASRLVLSAHDFFLSCPNGAHAHFPSVTPCQLKPMSAACLTSACDKRHYGHKLWRVLRHAMRGALFDLARERAVIAAIHGGMIDPLERSGIPADRIEVVLDPVTAFRSERISAENNRTFAYVGRLDYEKGADIAVQAAQEAGVPLRVIGQGPLRAALEGRYQNAQFHGQRTKEEIANLIGDVCALVMPSRYPEPFGLVAVEAMWSGLPVILPRTSFLAAEVESSGAGLLVKPGDATSLANAMRTLVSDQALRAKMSGAAYTNTRSFASSPDAWIDRLSTLYARQLSQSSRQARQTPYGRRLSAAVGGSP